MTSPTDTDEEIYMLIIKSFALFFALFCIGSAEESYLFKENNNSRTFYHWSNTADTALFTSRDSLDTVAEEGYVMAFFKQPGVSNTFSTFARNNGISCRYYRELPMFESYKISNFSDTCLVELKKDSSFINWMPAMVSDKISWWIYDYVDTTTDTSGMIPLGDTWIENADSLWSLYGVERRDTTYWMVEMVGLPFLTTSSYGSADLPTIRKLARDPIVEWVNLVFLYGFVAKETDTVSLLPSLQNHTSSISLSMINKEMIAISSPSPVVSASVVTLSGRVVRQLSGANLTDLSVAGITPGIYTVFLTTANQRVVKKICIDQ